MDAAAQVLASSGPLNCKELIDTMASQGLWTSPGGKTPHATLYAVSVQSLAAIIGWVGGRPGAAMRDR